ncbi:MAG: hypothetical protein HY657_04295 [Acidobacteria bacterium]|nr:hypothetical protein [Acidobacteriota bacterium]
MTMKPIALYRATAGTACAVLIATMPTMIVAQRPPVDATFAISNVTVIDVEGGSRAAGQTVVVRGSRIVAAGPSASVTAPAGVPVVDGQGKFLMPGVWDMHAHPYHNIPARTLPLAVAHGVTGIREMGGGIQHMADATRLIDEGLLAPRMFVAGPLLDGVPQGENFPAGTGLTILTPDEGIRVNLSIDI